MRGFLFFTFLSFSLCCSMLYSRPIVDPVDYSKIEGPTRKKKVILTDSDVVFTNEELDKQFKDPRILPLEFSLVGRALPKRDGKPLEKFDKGDFVKVLFRSKNRRWLAIESLKTSKKRWIPQNAVAPIDDKILEKKTTPETEEDEQ